MNKHFREVPIPRDLRRLAPPPPYNPIPLWVPATMLSVWLAIFVAWLAFAVFG